MVAHSHRATRIAGAVDSRAAAAGTDFSARVPRLQVQHLLERHSGAAFVHPFRLLDPEEDHRLDGCSEYGLTPTVEQLVELRRISGTALEVEVGACESGYTAEPIQPGLISTGYVD